jgi:hypothetical protein
MYGPINLPILPGLSWYVPTYLRYMARVVLFWPRRLVAIESSESMIPSTSESAVR